MAGENLADRLTAMDEAAPKTVLVVGDPMVDVWMVGASFECQDGCPCYEHRHTVKTPGGAANAVRQLGRWRSRVHLVGPWPSDLFTFGINHDCGITSNLVPIKRRWLAGGRVLMRADEEVPGYGADADLLRVWRRVAVDYVRRRRPNAVLISDYDKGWLDADTIRRMVGYCRERGVPCVADCKRGPGVYAGAILKGNLAWRARHDAEELPPRYVVTQGGDPPYGCDADSAFSLNQGPAVDMVNHVGAGDCFAAHLVLALAHGFALDEAAAVAHSAGRVYVQHEFGRPPLPCEVAADMSGTTV